MNDKKITVINSTHDPERYEKVDTVIRLDIQDEKRIVNFISSA